MNDVMSRAHVEKQVRRVTPPARRPGDTGSFVIRPIKPTAREFVAFYADTTKKALGVKSHAERTGWGYKD